MTKVFIGGSRHIIQLPSTVKERINNIIKNNFMVLIGDANGVDKCVQQFLAENNYEFVIVFCMAGACRNNVGLWETHNIEADSQNKNFHFYSMKDLEMAKEASYGLMIWDGKSKGTLNNVINLLKRDKKTLVYFSPDKSFYTLNNFHDLSNLLSKCDNKSLEAFEKKLGITQLLKEEQIELIFV
jgi:hypothetical protein